jgi:hypothetical protein
VNSKPQASELLQRMRTVATREKPLSTAEPPVPSTTPPAGKRIRYTLDLSPEQHRFLKRWAFDREVDASAVMRELLTELATDPDLAERLAERVQERRDG